MNIAIDSRSLERPSGVGRYLSNLLKYWRTDKEHKFVLYFKDKIPKGDLVKSDNFEKKILRNPFGFSSNFFFQHFLLPYNLKKDKADFFFSPFYLKPFYCPTRSSIVLHDISYEVHPEWFDFKSQFILRLLSKFSAETADKIFTVSNFSKNEIVRHYKIDSDKITVTYPAPDKDFVKVGDLNRIKAVKDKYGLGDRFILSVGSIFNRRHIPEIIEAFAKVLREYPGYQLLIIGKNCTHPFLDIDGEIKNASGELGKNAVRRLDFVEEEELQALYSSCEFAVYLSDYEGFGLPVVEAQFFGKPVITSYSSSLIEVGGNSVEFVGKNTVEEIYESFRKLISNIGYRENLVRLGEKNIKRFSWERCTRDTLEHITYNI
jgi:glycosyltransferase involved in cell wall biosynthesis